MAFSLNNNMRIPFTINDSKFEHNNARVKFSFTSPELHQNIEISLDGNDTSVEALLDAFQRFLGALGICVPEDVVLGFVQMHDLDNDDDEDDEDDDEDDQEDDDDDDEGSSGSADQHKGKKH